MSTPRLFVVGATHHRVPLAVRERLSLDPAAAITLQEQLATLPGMREITVLGTCNRVEFYGVADNPEIVERVAGAFCERQRFEAAEFARMRLDLADEAAVRHLLEVAAGLDSQIVGETEIFGQVKAAYAAAQAAGRTGPVLNRVFQKCFQAAKHVRTHSAINAGQVSVANVAVELALSIFGGLEDARILLLGAGEVGEKTARAFLSRGAAALTVSSRSLERAMELATALGASALPFEAREARLAEFDVVVCATAAPTTVISRAAVAAAMHRRPTQPLFLIDQALPRDVEPAVTDLENVFLYNLDDLAQIADRNRVARESELARCRAMAAERAAALWRTVAAQVTATPAGGPAAVASREQRPASA